MVRNKFNPALVVCFIATISLAAQNEITVNQSKNSICINGTDMGVDWYQFLVQDAEQWSNSVSAWSNSPDTCMSIPYCNFMVNRTAYLSPTDLVFSNVVEINAIDLSVKAWVFYPYVYLDIRGDWESVQVTMVDVLGHPVNFTSGNHLEVTTEGFHAIQPILNWGKINHLRKVIFIAQKDGCFHKTVKTVYY